MAVATLKSRALNGIEAAAVTVEVHADTGIPNIIIVGLPETEVRESRDRVKAAIKNSGYEVPQLRFTINLAPAELPKESSRFDLAIALGILIASHQINDNHLEDYTFVGELSLSGQLRMVQGVLPIALALKKEKCHKLVLPQESVVEASLVQGLELFPANDLVTVATFINGGAPIKPYEAVTPLFTAAPVNGDWSDIKGQAMVKRALEVAASGGHNVLMAGPPGSGKSMLAQRFVSILPPLTESEALEAATISSLNGSFHYEHWRQRPFRSPHHTASAVALVGGGSIPRPGEISLAHNGVLFLDELPEFERKVLEVLREPLETGCISISRAARQANFPARFQLIAAMNPCPCGYLGHKTKSCICSIDKITRYQSKLSGPLLDRIDMQLEVPAISIKELSVDKGGETSTAEVAQKVVLARQRQIKRQGKINALLSPQETPHFCDLSHQERHFLDDIFERLGWSARVYHRVLRLSRSIADYDGAEVILRQHIAEAVQFRRVLKV